MYCRNCSYSLRGCPSGKCPECGHPFHAKNKRTFLRDPSLANNRQKRQLAKWLVIVAGLVVAFHVWLGLPAPYSKLHEIELNSGDRRVRAFIFGWQISLSHAGSPLRALLDEHSAPGHTPEWRPFAREDFASLSAARVNYRYRLPATEYERLAELLTENPYAVAVPLQDQKRLARAALGLLRTADGPLVQEGPDELLVLDFDLNVIPAWKAEP